MAMRQSDGKSLPTYAATTLLSFEPRRRHDSSQSAAGSLRADVVTSVWHYQ